jgi:hypothetical protein
MKLYAYENLLSERFVVKEITEQRFKNKRYEEIFAELNVEGDFLIIENDEVKQYPECAKDTPNKDAIIHVKRIPKKDAGTASWWLGGVMALAGAALTIFTCGLGATIGGVAAGGRSERAGR